MRDDVVVMEGVDGPVGYGLALSSLFTGLGLFKLRG